MIVYLTESNDSIIMNLQQHYNQLYKHSMAEIASDNYEIDAFLNTDHDDRFGLSLIIRPSLEIKHEIQRFLRELQSVEPHQYYYPNSDIHITVISVISCYSGLKLSQIKAPEYIKHIKKCLNPQQPLTLSFKGVTASPSCIMIQGFMNDNSLNQMRDELRKGFKTSDLDQSMDERYLIQTAHATVFRFKEQLEHKKAFLEVVEKYRDYEFGTFEVDNIELVYNDWYHRDHSVRKLHEFGMKNNISDRLIQSTMKVF